MHAPFFILGNPRSGTSLFRLMLNSHPKVCVPPECGFLQWWYKKYNTWGKEDAKYSDKIYQFVADLLSSKKMETWKLNKKELIETIHKKLPSSYSELCQIVYYAMADDEDVLIGDKNNYYIHHLELINSIFPKTKFIHLVRDGRDVACSYKALDQLSTHLDYAPVLPTDIESIADEWAQNTTQIENFIFDKDSITIKYEELISWPKPSLQKICNFLGTDYSSQMLNYYKKEFHNEPPSTMKWKNQTLSAVNSDNYNKYKIELSPKDIELFNQIAHSQLSYYGYEGS